MYCLRLCFNDDRYERERWMTPHMIMINYRESKCDELQDQRKGGKMRQNWVK